MPKASHQEQSTDDENIAERLETVAEHAGRYARKVINQAPSMQDGTEAVTNALREDPVKYSLIALGVGLFLGLMLNRR